MPTSSQTGNGLSAKQQAALEQLLKGNVKLSREVKQDRIPKREVFSPVALSFSQQRLWILNQLVPDSAFYNIPSAFQITGDIDIDVFERSLKELIQRHESLRTVFKIIDEEPYQVILEDPGFRIERFDLRDLPGDQQETEAHRLLVQDAARPFDLEKGLMLRANLIQLEENKYIFHINTHHIISDTWSMEIFIKEFVEIHAALAQGKASPLPPLPIQYADFALWQREWLQGAIKEKQINFWKDVLSGELPILELPTDRQRPAVPTYRGQIVHVNIPKEATAKLMEINRGSKSSMFMNLLSIFYVLLYRWSGQDDILIGSPIANRKRVEVERLIGFFANTLVFRTHLDGNPSFLELLERVRKVTTAAYDNQDIPFEKLVEELQPDRYMSHTPFFQVMMVLQNVPHQEADASIVARSGEMSVAPVAVHSGSAKFDLWLSFVQAGDNLAGTFEYSTDIFDPSTIERLAGHFGVIVKAICQNPGCPIDDLEIMSEEEKNRLLYEWNDTGRDYQYRCLHHAIADQVERTPGEVAVTAPALENHEAKAGEKIATGPAWLSLTYQQLKDKASQLAGYLLSLGVRPGKPVGICMDRSLDMVVALLGILEAGGAYLPLDPEYPADRLAFMAEDAKLDIILSQEHVKDTVPGFKGQVICLDQQEYLNDTGAPGEETGPSNQVTVENLAYIIYTSGSTGQPKGVMIPHRAISNRLLWMQEYFQLSGEDRVLQKTPYSFDVSVWEFFWPLMNGARLVMAKPSGHKDSAYLVDVIKQKAITTIHFVPSMLNVFLETPGVETLDSLKRVICSGEALPYQYRDRFFQHMPQGAELYNLYGPTEAAVDVSYWHCQRDDKRQVLPIGRPVANTQLYILDKHLRPVPTGVHGELHIAGVQLAKGYLGRPKLTEEKFIASGGQGLFLKKLPLDPAKTFDKPLSGNISCETDKPIANGQLTREAGYRLQARACYKSGDLCRWLPDGTIEYIDRLDFQVKVRGFRIELGEIESHLRQHENVHDAVVLARADSSSTGSGGTGNENKKLIAYVIPDGDFMHLAGDQVEDWQNVFDDTYGKDSGQEEKTFNIVGWNSSYTGTPLPADEMRLWVDHTVERILSLQAQDIMEIGCGTGLFLFPLVPYCKTFLGTDIASEGLDYIQQQLTNLEQEGKTSDWAQVELKQARADDFDGITDNRFDLVFLNSVVQYFPSDEYLVKVLSQAAAKVRPGGSIFIGDVRDLSLLKMFHASVEFFRAEPNATREEVYRQMMSRLSMEQELNVHPGFFQLLSERVPRIGEVEVLLKYGRYENELSKFRYDVILHIGDDKENAKQEEPGHQPALRLDWEGDELNATTLAKRLPEILKDKETAPLSLLLTNLPNSRIDADTRVMKWLSGTGTEKLEALTVSDYLAGKRQQKGSTTPAAVLDPEDLRLLGEDLPYNITATPAPGGEPGRMDVLFIHHSVAKEEAQAMRSFVCTHRLTGQAKDYREFSNHPLLVKITGTLVPQLRQHLRDALPEYMVPSGFVLLDQFPLTANGKLDRRALPQPLRLLQEDGETYVAPSTGTENLLAQVWGDVLNLDKSKISMNHNFFQLGGDSINAIQVVSRLGKIGHHTDVQLLYRNQSIGDMAAALERQSPADTPSTRPDPATMKLDMDWEILSQQLPQGMEIEDVLPATPLQLHQIRYFEQGGFPDPPLFLFQRTYRTTNVPIDPGLLDKVMQLVSEKNANLRTFLLWKDLEEPVQVVCKKVNFELELFDYSDLDLDLDGKMERYEELLREDWRKSFSRSHSSAMRVVFVTLGDGLSIMFFAGDYMRLEGWSGNTVIADIFAAYNALAAGAPLPGSEPNCYKEYLFTIRGTDKEAAREFWQSTARDLPQHDLTVLLPGNQKSSLHGFGRTHTYLDNAGVIRLEKLLTQKGWSLSAMIQSLWTLLLSEITGQERVIFGMMNTGRSLAVPGIEYMRGQSINILPVINEVHGDDSLDNLIARTWDNQVAWSRFEYTNLDDIYHWLERPMDQPLFDHFMVIQNLSSAQGEIRGMDRDTTNYQQNSHLMYAKMEYPLRFDVFPGAQYCFTMEYYRRLFSDAAVNALLANLEALIHTVIESPGSTLEQLKNIIVKERYKEFLDAPANEFYD